MTKTSYPLLPAKRPLDAIGQLGGHVKSGIETPIGGRTGNPMALVSALPMTPESDKIVLTFLDRSDPVETFDRQAESGDNAVVIVPRDQVGLSIVKGVNEGDWRGRKVIFGDAIEEPVDMDVDPTGMDLAASDAWVDLVDELGCDCSKLGGYPLWATGPENIDQLMGEPMIFHHRLTADVLDMELGEGAVLFVFVNERGDKGCVCYQLSGGGSETVYHHYQ